MLPEFLYRCTFRRHYGRRAVIGAAYIPGESATRPVLYLQSRTLPYAPGPLLELPISLGEYQFPFPAPIVQAVQR